MKTNLFLLACAVFACSCNDAQPKNAAESDKEVLVNGYADSIKLAKSHREAQAEQAKNIGKTFTVNDTTLKNIAISGTILAYKDNAPSGELVLTDKKTQKVIQKLPFILNNRLDEIEDCVETADFDFDGNLDLLVPNYFNNEEVFYDNCVVYLYNNTTRKFEKNKSIGDAVSSSGDGYEILPQKKSISIYRKGGSQENYFDIYKIKNKAACQTQWITEHYGFEEPIFEISVQKTTCDGKETGKEKRYKQKPYPDDYKGELYYKKYVE